ncbi:MAG: hypothetical protein HYV28_21390, partial [Ignavibacteriales bacterium]|nr:hypothetical protein [Ignavibacteriales bacterium]
IPSDISDSNFVIYNQSTQTISVTAPNGGEVLNSGGSTNITWNSSGVTSVNIDYSTNNGVNWLTIINGTESDGFYTWSSIPVVSSTNCKVRVYDAVDSLPVDESNNTFTILPPPGISVISPNGGEQLLTGSTSTIRWSSTNIATVKIQLTTNNGASWVSVTDSTESDGNYAWTTPSLNSSLCKIRISDKANGVPVDESDNTFTILTTLPQQLTVTLPNGGEQLAPGTSQSIVWSSTGIDTVKIEYTTNSGQSWTSIAAKTESDGIYIWSPVPNVSSSNCKIRISDAEDGTPVDESDAAFSIVPQPTIRVTAPNGGERLLSGSTSTITWTTNLGKSTEDIPSVSIEFSADAGLTWSSISSATTNSGSYTWNPVPSISSALCRIRIADATDGTPSDISDSNFVIYNQVAQSVLVTAPNGGEILSAGASTNITWSSSGIASVNIEYSTNNGVNWNTIVNGTESDGFYFWPQVPNVSSTNCKVRIYDATDSLPFDESNSAFTILPAPSVTVLSPNGGQQLVGGNQINIAWISANLSKVKIDLTTDNGASWETQVDSTESDGIYLWTVPSRNSQLCKIRISENRTGNPVDMSDSVFSITTTTPQGILVTAPDGGESWPSGSSRNITWTSTGIDSVKIEFSTNNGVSWSTLVSGTISDGFYTWAPIPSVSSTNCKIRISDAVDGLPSDESNSVFTIAPEPAITVLTPNTSLIWTTNSSQSISWLSYSLPKVKIEFTTNNGATWTVIADSTPSVGTYLWTIPNLNSSLCKIRISDPVDGVPSDESDSSFTISNQVQQALTVLYPNGGESFEATTSQSITWTSSAINKVKIEYTTNNGLAWSIIVDSTESDGLYEWSPIPNSSSSLCKIRISDAEDGTPIDESNATFSITQARSITILYPNGGENLISGSLYQITWSSTGVNNVDIEYRVGTQGDWTLIVANTPSDGSYGWSPSGSSVGYKIRIRDALNGNTVDESDGTFTVLPEPSITVLTPNGNLNLQSGSTFNITWLSSNLQNVRIDLTTNNGADWDTITTFTGSDGTYEWTVPSINSNLCKIRISDTDSLPSDVSDSVFSIYNVSPQTITVTSPNGGELLTAGNTHNIQWSSIGVDSVKIEFTSDNGQNWSTIISSTASDGFYPWSVTNALSSNCRIRISDAADDFPFDISNDLFRIIPAGLVAVTSPNGGEVYISGSQTIIQWTSFNVPNVDIDFSSNSGATWSNIADSIASTGLFTWSNIPVANSDQCRIRVKDAIDGVPFDTSDANFSVVQSKQLRVTFPTLPTHVVSQDTAFQWYSVGVQRVNLEISVDNGLNWSSIASNVASTGAYYISIAAYPPSSQARFRITDTSDPTITDMSDAPFYLGFNPPKKVNSIKNTGESSAGKEYTVEWEITKEYPLSELQVSLDEGKTWTVADNRVGLKPGNYETKWITRSKATPLFRVDTRK